MAENETPETPKPKEPEQSEEKATAQTVELPVREPTLTDDLLEQRNAALEKDGLVAYRRWGFALYHSVTDEEAMAERLALGFKPRDAGDHYNLGCHRAAAEDYAGAIKSFSKALELDPALVEAKFNLALAQEKNGNLIAARKSWGEYLEGLEDADEAGEIKNHLTELTTA